MFGLFKKKTKKEVLTAQYEKLMKASYDLSHSNRRESDLKRAEAEEVLKKIDALKPGE